MKTIVNGIAYEKRNSNKKHEFLDNYDNLYKDLLVYSQAQLARKYTKEYGVVVHPASIRQRINDPLFPEEWRANIRRERSHSKGVL